MADFASFLLLHPLWAWLAVGAVFLTIEVSTGSGWLLWPAGSAALVAVSTLVLPLSPPAQAALFALATIVTTFIGRRYLRNIRIAGHDVNDPHARLVGHHGVTVGADRVFIDGKEWAAEVEGGGVLAPGARIQVTALVGGARLRVKPA